MKRIFLIIIIAMTLCGCNKKNNVLNNEYIKVDGLYIDESKDDSVMDIIYVFYTINSKDTNIDVSSSDLTLVINNANKYKPVIYDDYNPIYTNYYYSNESKTIYVGKSFKLCTTYRVPKDDLNVDNTITFNSNILNTNEIRFKVDKIISKKNLNEISMDLDKETFDTKYIQNQEPNNINSTYVVVFDYLPGITYREFNANLGNVNSLSHLLDMVDEVIINDKYPNNSAVDFAEKYLDEIRKNYGDEEFIKALNMYGYASEEDYKYSLVITELRNIATRDYIKETITEKEITSCKVEGTRDDKINSIIDDKLSEDKNGIYSAKALIKIRNEYGMKIQDEVLSNLYDKSIKQYK